MCQSNASVSAPLGSLEGRTKRAVPRYLTPLYRQDGLTSEQYRDYMATVAAEVDNTVAATATLTRPNTGVEELAEIAFCEACGEETPIAAHALDRCPHCGY